MSIDIWLKIAVKLRVRNKNRLIVESPILVRANRDRVEPITWAYKLRMDRVYAPNLDWFKASIHSRRSSEKGDSHGS